jgi:uncharacterized protein DUF6445
MKSSVQIVDRFYSNPDNVRGRALAMRYSEPEYLTGWRTQVWQPSGIKKLIERAFRVKIDYWDKSKSIEGGNGVFFTAFSNGRHAERLKVHFDEPPNWMSLLVYLTPDAPSDCGTSFWQHRETDLTARATRRDALRLGFSFEELSLLLDRDGWKRKRWIEVDRIGNIYNRAVMFPAGRFHSATHHFGHDLKDGRLYQSFHFETAADFAAERFKKRT